ncbi:lysozyme [Lysobacter koreensis]|uniref:Lysozyme n=1 Tax=Lysobacter koreensis TaxID=266122 RepID=A0ABW2YIK3_9GAMM
MSNGKVIVTGVLAGAMAAALGVASFVKPWEGRRLTPYQDIVGVWTWCEGITRGERQDRYTHAQCDALLRNEVAIHLNGLAQCISRPLEQNEWVAVGSLGFNVGVGALCRSTLVKLINAGQPATVWCRQILRWNKAGGREVRGLTRRRVAEYEVCIQ